MDAYRSKLVVRNRRDAPHVVVVEPWASDYTLMSGEAFEIVALGKCPTLWFQIHEHDNGSHAFCEEADDFEVIRRGVRLPCGHYRLAGPEG